MLARTAAHALRATARTFQPFTRQTTRAFGATASTSAEKIAVIGSGNWGSVAARIVGQNAKAHADVDDEVKVWVFEETVEHDGADRKLTEVINETHENVKYLPGCHLGDNVVAEPDLLTAVDGATMLVFVTPHQFIGGVCDTLRGKLPDGVRAVSLVKGMEIRPDGFDMISELVTKELGIDCSVLMGANIANEIGLERFSEATVGYADAANGEAFRRMFHTDYFHVRAVEDVAGAELCGTLKNIVALGAGFVDGLGLGNNTKAAIIRIGLVEMKRLSHALFPGQVKDDTFFESAGVADLITTCFGGRNRLCAEAYVASGGEKSFDDIEAELLNGQKLQGVLTSNELQVVLDARGIAEEYPLFTTINRICGGHIGPERIVDYAKLP